jgi:uncharacterized protein YegP (UPF0339 family)
LKWVFYRDKKRLWHWKRKGARGRVIEASQKGYEDFGECQENAIRAGWTKDAPTKVASG